MTHLLMYLAIALRTLGLIFAILFCVRYSRLPWRRTREGRHLMSFSAVVAAFLLYATVLNVFHNLPGRLEIGVLLFAAVAFEMWRRNRLLTLARRQH